MPNNYKFEEVLSSEMPLPPTIDSIAAVSSGYAALVHVLNKRDPGLAEDVLSALDSLYEMNKDLPGRFAIAQLASTIRVVGSKGE